MSSYKIAVIVGSLRRNSLNRSLADTFERFAPAEFVFTQLPIHELPLYNQDEDAHPSGAVTSLKTQIAAADGLIFVTPEYNRSVPGVLKNAIDHASRPYGQNAWKGKPAGVLGASIGANGTAMAQQHLRNILAYLEVDTLTQPEAFIHIKSEANALPEAIAQDHKDLLQRWMDHYVAFVKKHLE